MLVSYRRNAKIVLGANYNALKSRSKWLLRVSKTWKGYSLWRRSGSKGKLRGWKGDRVIRTDAFALVLGRAKFSGRPRRCSLIAARLIKQ